MLVERDSISVGRTAACVVFSTEPPPSELLDALLARQVDVRVERDPYATIAALYEARPGPGQPRVPVVLILVEPDDLPMLARVLTVVERVTPGATLWRHAADRVQPLAAVTPAERRIFRGLDATGATGGSYPPDQVGLAKENHQSDPVGHQLRLTGDAQPEDRANSTPRSSDTDSTGERVLTEAELQILLGGTPAKEQRTSP